MSSVSDNRKLINVEPGVLEAAKNRCVERLKTDPLAIIPINFACTAIGIKDPLQVAAEFVPDKEDIGIVIVSVIGCVPVIGPLLQGAFTIFWRRASPSDTVSKEELNKAISDLRDEIIGIINEKIRTSEIEMWKSMLQSLLEGLTQSCGILSDNFTKLKYKLLKGEEISDDFTDDLRTKIDILNDKVLSLIAFCNNEKYSQHVVPYLLQCLFVYVLLIRTIESYWYQFEIDEIHVVGRPEDKELGLDAIPSYREILHNNIVKNLKKLSDMYCINPKEVENLPQLLKSDIITYPVPLIVYDKENIPPVTTNVFSGGSGIPRIEVPDRQGSFIFRIDGINFQPDPSDEDIRGYRAYPSKEFITGCKGVFLEYKPRVLVNSKRPFKLRIFASLCHKMYSSGNQEELKTIVVDHVPVTLQESIGCVVEPSFNQFDSIAAAKREKRLVSGFFISDMIFCGGYPIEFQPITSDVSGVIHCIECIFK